VGAAQQLAEADLLIEPVFEVFQFKIGDTTKPAGG